MRRICVLIFSLFVLGIYANDENIPIVENNIDLQKIKADKIIWKKDSSVMVRIPATKKIIWQIQLNTKKGKKHLPALMRIPEKHPIILIDLKFPSY